MPRKKKVESKKVEVVEEPKVEEVKVEVKVEPKVAEPEKLPDNVRVFEVNGKKYKKVWRDDGTTYKELIS